MTASPPRGELDGIDTRRLTLRRPRLDDFDDSATMWSDPRVTRHIGGKPFGREEAWLRFLRTIGHWTVMGFGFWIVRERTTGRFVGEVGLAEFRRDLARPLPDAPEAGWVIAPWAHGQGFATEAVPAAIAAYAAPEPAPRSASSIPRIPPRSGWPRSAASASAAEPSSGTSRS